MTRRPVSIRWLLLGVGCASLLVPVIALLALRSFDVVLVRETERELNAQGALIAAETAQAWADREGRLLDDPRPPARAADSFVPLGARIADLNELSPPLPEEPPARTKPLPTEWSEFSERMSAVLRSAQVFNLSGVRVLDKEGCALASSRGQLDSCFAHQPEVRSALAGHAASALRERVSDEAKPPLGTFRRRGDLRVFVALPIFESGQLVGAVLLSRTAESGLEWLFKNRRGIFFRGVLVLVFIAVVSLLFSWFITRPLGRMVRLLETGGARLGEVTAPREIHQLGVALDERAAELEAKSAYVTDFASTVSHELKTPLTSIQGAVELLEDEQMPLEQRRRFLHNIRAAAERTERLVSRLLTLARAESSVVDADADLTDVAEWLRAFAEARPGALELSVDLPEDLRLPAGDLESVVGNLADNALRARREAPVRLRACWEAPHLVLTVQDDGPGISAENQQRVFTRFFTTQRDQGGTGLGLAIVRAIARRRGGDVTLSSHGEGTTVQARLRPVGSHIRPPDPRSEPPR